MIANDQVYQSMLRHFLTNYFQTQFCKKWENINLLFQIRLTCENI